MRLKYWQSYRWVNLWVVALFYSSAWAQSQASIDAELDLRSANLGDPVTWTVTIRHPQAWSVIVDPLDETLGKARVLSQQWLPQPKEAPAKGAMQTSVFQARLAWYELGDFKVPAHPFSLASADESDTLMTPELAVTIAPLLDENDQQTAPAKGQVALDVPSLWPWLLAGALVLILVGAFLYHWVSRRQAPPAQAKPAPPPKPPYQEAIDALNALTMSSLLKEGRTKEFYVAICNIVRHYYARLWQVHAEEWTSFELENWLEQRRDLPNALPAMNKDFHDRCDLVKFARHDPAEAETKAVVNGAYQIVELLKPKEADHVATR